MKLRDELNKILDGPVSEMNPITIYDANGNVFFKGTLYGLSMNSDLLELNVNDILFDQGKGYWSQLL